MKGGATFRHDLFKGDVRKMKRNVSYKKGVVNILELEHTHNFHSHDQRGRPQEYCTPNGGHFHKITIVYDEHGAPLRAECGPPLKYQNKKTPLGSKRRITEVRWQDGVNDREVRDDHRHVFDYIHSEELSAKRIQQIRAATSAAIGGMTGGAKPQLEDTDGRTADDVGLEEGDAD